MHPKNLIAFICPALLIVSALAVSGESADSHPVVKEAGPAAAPGTPWVKTKYDFKVSEASDEGELAIKKFKLDKDMKCELFAAEPLVANIVAFSVDEKGRFFVAETFRVGEGVIDNRGHMDWLDEDLNSRSVEDRAAFQKRHLGADTEKTLGFASERIKLVEDRSGKGKADFSSVFATGFDTILDGVGAGIFARKGQVFFTNIPNLWLLKDEKNEGYATYRKSLHYGFGVRNAFMGHDLHGLKMGPDGRIYFSIGDRGARVKTEGRLVDNPDSGCVFRCNPDGSQLEIFATGLRNPQSLSFDRYGNLFTGDNNADSGDKARWEYIVEGGDYGWRIGFQYIKQPALGPFNVEKMWHEQEPDQPKYNLPPVGLITNGPSGNVYYPGTGMPERYKEHFFLCDFTGGITAKVHSFRVQPKGASFELVDRAVLIEGCLCTDVCWGVNGGLYVSDWVEGWTKTGKGRIYRIFEDKSVSDPLVADVRKLLAEGFDQRNLDELVTLLSHPDLRIRQEAQFAIVDQAKTSAESSISAFEKALKQNNQSAKLHALWGLEMIARSKPYAIEALIPVLSDTDAAVAGQAARMLGDRHCEKAIDALLPLLKDKSARVRFHAANALGKMNQPKVLPAIFQMLREAEDKDPYLRHAGVMALVWNNDMDSIMTAAKDESPAVRVAALLALRRMERNEIALFCTDKDPAIVLEAARAINDVPISGAMPELAALIDQPSYSDALMKRVINANFRLGTEASAQALAKFAAQDAANSNMRAEALNDLGDWIRPPLRDKVTNLFRPIQAVRDPAHAAAPLKAALEMYFKTSIDRVVPENVRTAAISAAEKLNIPEAWPMMLDVVNDGGMPAPSRVAALKALTTRSDPKLIDAARSATNSGDYTLRREGLSTLGRLNAEEAAPILNDLLSQQVISSKRLGIASMADWPGREPERLIASYLDDVIAGKMEKELILDVLEAAAAKAKAPPPPEPPKKEEPKKEDPKKDDSKKDPTKTDAPKTGDKEAEKHDKKDPEKKEAEKKEPEKKEPEKPAEPYVRPDFKAKLEKYEALRGPLPTDQYKESLYGGDIGAGHKVFFEKAEASCVRCHKIGNRGGEVGPNLSDVGKRKDRDYILESIVDPNKVIAPGFESVLIKTKDGQHYTGVVKKEDDKTIVVADGTTTVSVPKDTIQVRKTGKSPMPEDIAKQLTKREVRDLVEFLFAQKTEPEKPKPEDAKHQ